MAAMSNADVQDAARVLARRIFVESQQTANLTHADLQAAVQSIDDMMNAPASTLTQGSTVQANFLANLPAPFKGTATLGQKSLCLAAWAMKAGGVI